METGKIAAFANMLPTAIYLTHANQNISFITEPLKNDYNYASFTNSERGRELCAEYEKFLKTLWDDGTIKKLADKWIFSADDQARIIDNNYLNPPASKGVLKMAVDTGRMPFAYVKDNKITGYDIELVSRFCKAMGYGLEVYSMDFGGILGSIKTGKCDLTGSITWTKERAETMLYSQVPNAAMDVVLLVLKDDSQNAAAVLSFFDELKASFARTFIREDRWKLFVDGIANTMIITILSIILGTLLGFAVYLLCRKGLRAALLVTRFFIWLIKGMPMVVLLMILYYIIFGKVDVSGLWVAVIAFTLTFGASVYLMLKSSADAIDNGQSEAGYALGFSDRQTFFRIILPQAVPHFMPIYKAEVSALVKSTAIVGYIAVQDLTKMGDIVRSRTYEAFFPLIAVAVLYFVMAGALNFIVNLIQKRIDPKLRTREKILKGINTGVENYD